MMQKARTTILARTVTTKGYYLLKLGNPFVQPVQPGQFVMISVADIHDPFLKRPYSIYRAFPKSMEKREGEIHLLIKTVGRGSVQMGDVLIGSNVEILGPLGKPFSVPLDLKQALFVAGGIGVAPFVELAAQMADHPAHKTILIGGRSALDIQGVEDLEALGVNVRIATEDGSAGTKGLVTQPLMDILSEGVGEGTQIFSCGPEPMMKAVATVARRNNVPCQLSLEAIMGCGIGVCLGCVVKDADGRYIRVCKEGPVMDAANLAEYGRCSGGEDK
jgi:dihydroorotate dehydrogenase electron transfer subunit